MLLLCNWSSMSHRALSEVKYFHYVISFTVWGALWARKSFGLVFWIGSWIFSGTQRDQVCKCKRSAGKRVVVPSLTRTYDLNQNTRYTVQAFKYLVSFRTPCSVYYDPSSFFSVSCKACTPSERCNIHGSFLVCFCDSCVSARRFLRSGLYNMKLTAVFPAILCVLQEWGDGPAKAPGPQFMTSLFQCTVSSSLWVHLGCRSWNVFWYSFFRVAELDQTWILAAIQNNHKGHPACGGAVKLKFCQLVTDPETNYWPQKRTGSNLTHRVTKTAFL